MQPVVPLVHPLQRGVHGGLGHQNAQAVAAQRTLDGAAPGLLGLAHFDQLGGKGQVAFWHAQVLGQLSAKALKLHGQVGARALAHGVVLGLGVAQAGVGVVGLGDGVFGVGLQLGLFGVDLLHRRLGLGLMADQVVGLCVVPQPQVARQCLVLRQVVRNACQLFARMLDVLLQRFDAGTTCLQVQAVQVLLVLAGAVDLRLRSK